MAGGIVERTLLGLIMKVNHLNEEGRPASSHGASHPSPPLGFSRSGGHTPNSAYRSVYLDPISTTSKFGTFTRALILTHTLPSVLDKSTPEQPLIVTKGKKKFAKPVLYSKKLYKPTVVHRYISIQGRLKMGGETGVVVVCAQGTKSDLLVLGSRVTLGVGASVNVSRELDAVAFELATEVD